MRRFHVTSVTVPLACFIFLFFGTGNAQTKAVTKERPDLTRLNLRFMWLAMHIWIRNGGGSIPRSSINTFARRWRVISSSSTNIHTTFLISAGPTATV